MFPELTLSPLASLSEAQHREDALVLARGALALFHDQADDSLDEHFSEVLSRTVKEPPAVETAIFNAAFETLREHEEPDAAAWLYDEAQLEAECQFITDAFGDERMVVLFAIPVIFSHSKGENLTRLPNIEALHDLMEQAEIIGATAQFGLLPYYVAPETLTHRTFSEIAELTRFLGQQVVDQEGPELQLGACLPGAQACEASEVSSLRYIVGVAAVSRPEDAKDLFWEEPEAPADVFSAQVITQRADFQARGVLEEGETWESAFADALERDTDEVVLTVGAPAGFHDDLQFGNVLLREEAFTVQFHSWLEDGGSFENLRLTEHPVQGPNQELQGWMVWMVSPQGHTLGLNWYLLPGECWEEGHGMLHDVLGELGLLSPQFAALMQRAPGQQWIH